MFSWSKKPAAEPAPVGSASTSPAQPNKMSLDDKMKAAAATAVAAKAAGDTARTPDGPSWASSMASNRDRGPAAAAPSTNGGTGKPSSGSSSGGGPAGGGAPSGGAASAPPGDGIFKHAAPEGHAKKVSEVLGEVVWLMSQSPLHKQFYIQDLE